MARSEGGDVVLAASGSVLAEARRLFDAFRWRDCVDLLAGADTEQPLDGDGLMLLGQAAYLIGADELAATALARAYQRFLDAGDVRAAARSALSSAFVLENAGERVRCQAWVARAERLADEHDVGGGEGALLLAQRAHQLFAEQRLDEALSTARDAERAGLAARDVDAVVLARATIGWSLLIRGRRAEAIQVLDEVMLAVSSDETSPAVVGVSYCLSVAACVAVRDVVRARSWTATLDRWCAARPTWWPTAARAWSTGRRCRPSAAIGRRQWTRPRRRSGCCGEPRPERPPTSKARCTG